MWWLLLRAVAGGTLRKQVVKTIISQGATGKQLNVRSVLKIALQERKGKIGGFWDAMYGGNLKGAWKNAVKNTMWNPKSYKWRTTLSPWEKTRRAFRKDLWKTAFRTVSWKYLKEQLRFAKNQGTRGGLTSFLQLNQQIADARQDFNRVVGKEATSNRQIRDSSPLSSSWCLRGSWINNPGSDDPSIGTLQLTTKIEKKRKKRVISWKVGKSYNYHNLSLVTWILMKHAMGRDGSGAGTQFWRTYLRGWPGGKTTPTTPYGSQIQ